MRRKTPKAILGFLICLALCSCAQPVTPKDADNAELWKSTILDGNSLYENGNYKEAEEKLRAAVSLAEDSFGVQDPRTGTSYLNLGNLYCDTGKYEKAETYQLNALTIWQAMPKQDDSLVALASVNLGETLRKKGNLQEAQRVLEQAQEIYGKPELKADANGAVCNLNLALVYRDLGKLDDAEKCIDNAVKLDRSKWGKESRQVASDLHAKALIAITRSENDAAKGLLREAVDIQGRTLGNEHPDIAVSLANLANLEKRTGDTTSARNHYKRAYQILSTKFDHDSPVLLSVARDYLEFLKPIDRDADESAVMEQIKLMLTPIKDDGNTQEKLRPDSSSKSPQPPPAPK